MDEKRVTSDEPLALRAMTVEHGLSASSSSDTSSNSGLPLSPVGTSWSRSPPLSPQLSPASSRSQSSWCDFGCFRRSYRRYWFIGLALLLLLTLLWSNPYRWARNEASSFEDQYDYSVLYTAHETPTTPDGNEHEKSKPTSTSSKPASASSGVKQGTEGNNYKTMIPHPEPDPKSDQCTTWPVDKKTGAYKPPPRTTPRHHLTSYAPVGGWKKPEGIRIVAMIFFGRRRKVDILDCYMRANLAAPGGNGYLDEVRFMVNTVQEDDVAWLRELTAQVPQYQFVDLGDCHNSYGCIWENAVDDDTIYVKIDDDIMFIHPDAIPQLIHTRIEQPHPYAVSAQLVNSPVTGFQAMHYGAVHPFLPDPRPAPSRPASSASSPASWRPSEMGLYPPGTRGLSPDTRPLDVKPSYPGHHWVLLTDNPKDAGKEMLRTPMGDWNANPGAAKIAFGPGWTSWAAAAQQEYSLMYNIEMDTMDKYFFGRAIDYGTGMSEKSGKKSGKRGGDMSSSSSSRETDTNANDERRSSTTGTSTTSPKPPGGEQLYDMLYQRYNLNFVAIWGSDVSLGLPIADDELEITAEIPRRLGRPFVIDTRAVVAHHSFFTQSEGIKQTDLLDRWRALANELVCEEQGNIKVPWDGRCEGF